MNLEKQLYLNELRDDSLYAPFRKLINVFAVIGYVFAGFVAFSFLIGGFSLMNAGSDITTSDSLINDGMAGFSALLGVVYMGGGLIAATIITAASYYLSKGATIAADTADCLLDYASKDRSTTLSWEAKK